ncbi:hypothetical protein [Flavobacterium sp.]
MKHLKHLFFILPVLFFGQNKSLNINIVSVTSVDSIPEERKFTIRYSIENTTDIEVSFFLEPERLFPAHSNAMATGIFYKLFQEKEELIINGIFLNKKFKKIDGFPDFSKFSTDDEREKAMQNYMEEYMKKENDSIQKFTKNGVTEIEAHKIKSSSTLLKVVYSLKPKETKTYSTEWYWDKKRYFKRDEFEYYLNEKSSFYLQFYLFLMKEQYQNKLTTADYEKLMKIPNFLKGVYQSEKVEINLKE